MARIVKSPKLPKLKMNKFKCGMCGCKFEVHDTELLQNITESDHIKVVCPFCESYFFLGVNWYDTKYPRTHNRIMQYRRIKKNNERLYGPQDIDN